LIRQGRKKAADAAEALRAAVASEDAQDSSPGQSSSLTTDDLEGRLSQEGSVVSAASTKEGPADRATSYSSAWSEREMPVEKCLMAQLLPEPLTLASSQSYYPIPCCHAQLAPGTLLPLEGQCNCGSSIPPSNFVYLAPPLGIEAGAGEDEIDLSVSNFAGQFPGNVDFEYQYPRSPRFDEGSSTPVRHGGPDVARSRQAFIE
jgi:hypothetical protein